MTVIPRVGVVVLDFGRPLDAEQAAASARDPTLDVRVLIVENGRGGPAPRPDRLRLPENRGFAGGMNAGLERDVTRDLNAVFETVAAYQRAYVKVPIRLTDQRVAEVASLTQNRQHRERAFDPFVRRD